jgi:hypothetical integral membrane protein (TIGR02206 family)
VSIFSPAHLAALAVLALACGISIRLPRDHPGRWATAWAWLLALVILAGWLGEYAAEISKGQWTASRNLPLQLTDAVSLTAVIALLSMQPLLVELTYSWSLTATLQAVITPDLSHDFPNVYYFVYFAYHGGAIAAGCFLVFGCRIYPRPGAIWRVAAATLAFAAVAGLADILTGGNYMYLRARPRHASVLSAMGPWPWYLVVVAFFSLGLLAVVALVATTVRRRDPAAERLERSGTRGGGHRRPRLRRR